MAAALVILVTTVWLWIVSASRPAPTGQVVARVGSQDITEQDLRAEARAQGAEADTASRSRLLDAVVMRAVLAQAADSEGLDRSPDAPADLARAAAQARAEMILRALPTLGEPAPEAVARYEARHPEAFAQRRILTLTELFASDPRFAFLPGEPLDQLRARLAAAGLRYRESVRQVATDALPPSLLKVLEPTTGQGVAVWRSGDRTTAIQATAATDAPRSGAEAVVAAEGALRREAREAQLRVLVDSLEHRTLVRYQPGFAPRGKAQPPGDLR